MEYKINNSRVKRKNVENILDEGSIEFVEQRLKDISVYGIKSITTKVDDDFDVSISI